MKQNYSLLVALTILTTLWATSSLIVLMGVLTMIIWQALIDTSIDKNALVWAMVSFLNIVIGVWVIIKIERKIDSHTNPVTLPS